MLGHVVVVLTIFAATEWVDNRMTKRLDAYISRKEFELWQVGHSQWGDQVIKNQTLQIEEISRRMARIESKLDEQLRRP